METIQIVGEGRPILAQLGRGITPELYRRIRRTWLEHCIAEKRRDIPRLLATMTEDCVYELGSGSVRSWYGHAGAADFYRELNKAFPDIEFELLNIVIGPQGVFEEARATAVHQSTWMDYLATGERVEFDMVLYFPWDMMRGKFSGERVYFFNIRRASEQ